MNAAIKNQIISELDYLPDSKVDSLLDYLHFLTNDSKGHYPNAETIDAIKEVENDKGTLNSYSSASEMFDDLGIDL